jgi:hypothetical protein
VLLANGGKDMLNQMTMVRRIAQLAKRDDSIVGVVGMGRDTSDSDAAAKVLSRAGLPIVDTTNSGGYLATDHANYFGMAATDEEETQAMLAIAKRQAGAGKKKAAVVLSRQTVNSDHDRYTVEQAKFGESMLRQAGFAWGGHELYQLGSDGSPDLTTPVTKICAAGHVPEALYFAGRVEDVPVLMDLLHTTDRCSTKSITIYTGDDLSKADPENQSTTIARNVTLYYTSLAPMDQGKGSFYGEVRQTFRDLAPGARLPAPANPWYQDKLFASGQTVLSYEATAALYKAASFRDEPQNAAETWGNLRWVKIDNMPTGTVTFRGTQPYAAQDVHGINVIRVWYRDGRSTPTTRILCGRASGVRTPKLTELGCPSQ